VPPSHSFIHAPAPVGEGVGSLPLRASKVSCFELVTPPHSAPSSRHACCAASKVLNVVAEARSVPTRKPDISAEKRHEGDGLCDFCIPAAAPVAISKCGR
jgi:hypothetical protein